MRQGKIGTEKAQKEQGKQKNKNFPKKCKKGVDKADRLVYNSSSRHERSTQNVLGERHMILENDTESRRTRTAIFTSRSLKRDSQFRMSFELEVKTSRFNTGFNTRV